VKVPPSAQTVLHDDSPGEVEGSTSQSEGRHVRAKAMPLNSGAQAALRRHLGLFVSPSLWGTDIPRVH
jgi:hypothetical protein